MKTVPLPTAAVHRLGPQQGACTPRSPLRKAGSLLIMTFVDPWIDMPLPVWGQPTHPCRSGPNCAMSPSRAAAGIRSVASGSVDVDRGALDHDTGGALNHHAA